MNERIKTLYGEHIGSPNLKGLYWEYCIFKTVSYAVWKGCHFALITDINMYLLMRIIPASPSNNVSQITVHLYPIFYIGDKSDFSDSIRLNIDCPFQRVKFFGNLLFHANKTDSTFIKQ